MSDTHMETTVFALDGPIDLPPSIPVDERRAMAAIDSRETLLRSDVFRRNAEAVQRITYAIAHRPALRAPVQSRRGFIRVVAWNIQRGARVDGINSYLRSHPQLRHADVLLLSEVDVGMARSGNRDIAAEIAEACGYHCLFGNGYLCLNYGDAVDGEGSGENAVGLHGNAILSRFPILRAENFSLSVPRDRFIDAEKVLGHRKALWAEIDTPLGPLPVVAVHLDAVAGPRQRAKQMGDVLTKVRERGLAGPVLLGGDFNTSTYDLESWPRLGADIVAKFARGGFPHVIHSYLHPYEQYEAPLFDALTREGFDYRSYNVMGVGTTRYEAGTRDSEANINQHVPKLAAMILRWKLRPWNGVAALKIDWFAGKGVRALQGGTAEGDGEAPSGPPMIIAKPEWEGERLSDHDPIVVDVAFGG